ncbi:MAG: DUF4062 domain-containing protein [Anaerolineae bacterium]
MAKPRIFISSTFYDLRQIREDLRLFIEQLGYDPVLHELGNITYGVNDALESYCYREIDLSDIVVSIVGDRYGTPSKDEPYSISQKELKTAIDHGKQVYIFVLKAVLAGYPFYLKNRELDGVQWPMENADKIYEFISDLYGLPNNNQITPFETSQDIIRYLREQLAGLLHSYLRQQEHRKELNVIDRIQTLANSLNQLVTYLTEKSENTDTVIQEILLSSNPAFNKLKRLTGTTYRVFFTNKDEMKAWLEARGYKYYDIDVAYIEEGIEMISDVWQKKPDDVKLLISFDLFDNNGNLKMFTEKNWNENLITTEAPKEEEEIPF